MDHMTHEGHRQAAEPDAGSKMSGAHGDHDRHAGHSVAMFRDKFWLSFALTIPVVFWSTDVQHWLGYTAPSFPGSKFIPAILGTFVFIYGGLVFIRGAWGELADRKPGMMTLISLAMIVAFGTSLAATFGLFEIEVWWELASLIPIMVLGHWLEMRAISQARGALNALAALLPDTAESVNGSETQTVPISELKVGDVVPVRPGTRVPADGTVVEGTADVDESMITGESRTVAKGAGGKVIAGTVASGGSLRVRVTAVGELTALSGIMRLVATAQASGSRTQALADRAAAILFYVAVASGATTLTYWWLAGDKEHALIRTATVLIIACLHALGLAIPLVIAISTSVGAQNAVRGWRPAITGTLAGVSFLTLLVLGLGPTLQHIPITTLQLVVGVLLVLFGMRWLRKAILRSAGVIGLHDEEAIFIKQANALRPDGTSAPSHLDIVAIATTFKAVVLEGLEVVFIVIATGAVGHMLIPASLGAAAAGVLVILLGLLIHKPLSRVPENMLKFAVGILLSAFGVFWVGEGLRFPWPGEDLSLFGLVAGFLTASGLAVLMARRAAASSKNS